MKYLYDALSYYMGIVVITLKIMHLTCTEEVSLKKILNKTLSREDIDLSAYKL